MKMPRIHDKEAVPVRALPHLTQFHPLAPDKVAQLLAENDRRHKWTIRAYQRSHDGALIAWPPRQWDAVFARLEAEAARIRASGTSLAEQDVELDDRLVALLPAGVFLWRDELEAEYQRTFGRMGPFPSIKPDAPDLEPATQRVFALIDSDPNGELGAALDAEQAAIEDATRYREGDGVLDIDGTPDPDETLAAVIYAGFEENQQEQAGGAKPCTGVTRKAIAAAFPDVGNWEGLFGREEQNGLSEARLALTSGRSPLYDAEKIAQWVTNKTGENIGRTRKKLLGDAHERPSDDKRPGWGDALMKG